MKMRYHDPLGPPMNNENEISFEQSENQKKREHAGYEYMSPREQWDYDKRHGMLDD